MGEAALKMHAKGIKHASMVTDNTCSQKKSIKSLFVTSGTGTQPTVEKKKDRATSSRMQPALQVSKNDCLEAEVLWAIKVVRSHYSFNSSTDTNKLFSRMFKDSNIAIEGD